VLQRKEGINMAKIVFYDTAQLERIMDAVKQQDWFNAVVLSAIQLEHNGCAKIEDYLESLNANPELIDNLLETLYLKDVAKCLKTMEIIDSKEFSNIMKINDARNAFVHRRRDFFFHKRKSIKLKRGKEAQETYEPLVLEAVRILKEKLDVVRGFVARS
jgi:hypothetical protein